MPNPNQFAERGERWIRTSLNQNILKNHLG